MNLALKALELAPHKCSNLLTYLLSNGTIFNDLELLLTQSHTLSNLWLCPNQYSKITP